MLTGKAIDAGLYPAVIVHRVIGHKPGGRIVSHSKGGWITLEWDRLEKGKVVRELRTTQVSTERAVQAREALIWDKPTA